MKRYARTLLLRNDPALMEEYKLEHQRVWPEIREGIREVGILDMEIYILDNRLFMIVDTVDDFDLDRDYARLAELPRQREWERYMSRFQDINEDATADQKWHLMELIFKL